MYKKISKRWQNQKYQKSLSPTTQQFHWQNLWHNCFVTLLSVEGLGLSEVGFSGKVRFILDPDPVAAIHHPPLSLVACSCTCAPGAAYTQFMGGARAGNKRTLSSEYQGCVWSVMAASNHRGANKHVGGSYCCTSPIIESSFSSSSNWGPPRRFRGRHPCSSLHFSFSPLGRQKLKKTTCNNNRIYGKN